MIASGCCLRTKIRLVERKTRTRLRYAGSAMNRIPLLSVALLWFLKIDADDRQRLLPADENSPGRAKNQNPVEVCWQRHESHPLAVGCPALVSDGSAGAESSSGTGPRHRQPASNRLRKGDQIG